MTRYASACGCCKDVARTWFLPASALSSCGAQTWPCRGSASVQRSCLGLGPPAQRSLGKQGPGAPDRGGSLSGFVKGLRGGFCRISRQENELTQRRLDFAAWCEKEVATQDSLLVTANSLSCILPGDALCLAQLLSTRRSRGKSS